MSVNFVVCVKINTPKLLKFQKCPQAFENGSQTLLPLILDENH